jgi:hypothetical protein
MLWGRRPVRHIAIMGLSPAKLLLDNPRLPSLQSVEVEALADTQERYFCASRTTLRISFNFTGVPRRK